MGIISATFAVQPVMLEHDVASRRWTSGLSSPGELVHRVPSPETDRQPRPHMSRRTYPNIAPDTQPCPLGAQQTTRCLCEQSGLRVDGM
jgi:hypothetical protein